jgi:dihydrofolate synthase/folylpolyglutamate synthase
MRRLLELLDHPELHAPVIHIAGTKGKGSVAWLLSQTLIHSGMRTGLYTSPHLEHLEERFRVQGEMCGRDDIVAYVDLLRNPDKQLADEGFGFATFFELTTAIGWLHFRAQKVDCAVVEVGLGGRLDSTNVCRPELCIITSISMDHQAQLGNTLAAIAGEKAGIIKPGVTVVSGAVAPEAANRIRDEARARQAELWELHRDFEYRWSMAVEAPYGTGEFGLTDAPDSSNHRPLHGGYMEYARRSDGRGTGSFELKLLGEHQAANAAIVCAAVDYLRERGWDIPGESLEWSLATTQVPARLEVMGQRPWVLVDTAHNVASIEALLRTLEDYFRPARSVLVFSVSRDKDYIPMLVKIVDHFDDVVLTQFQTNPRAVPVALLEQTCREVMVTSASARAKVITRSTPAEAWNHARSMCGPEDLLCVAGSFFLVAELLPLSRHSLPGGTARGFLPSKETR